MTHAVSTTPFIPTSIEYAKAKAKLLRKLVADLDISLALAQQTTAKALGHKDWHALDEVLKNAPQPSALSQDVAAAEQSARWRTQRDALLALPEIEPGDVPGVLEEWTLTGTASSITPPSDLEVRQAVDRAWPKDSSQLEAEVRNNVRHIVQKLLENPTAGLLGSLKQIEFASTLNLQLVPVLSIVGQPLKRRTASETLKEVLVEGNDAVYDLCSTAASLLGAGTYIPSQRGETLEKVEKVVAERLYEQAIRYAQHKSLWDLLFQEPGPDGLVAFRNTGQGLSLPDDYDDGEDDEGEDDGLDDDTPLPPFPPAILVSEVAPGMRVEVMHVPDFNEYEDTFRLTRIRANLRTTEGDNIGFLNGRLYESAHGGIGRMDLLMVADSQSQAAMEMAEAITEAFPRVTKCFDQGALFHIQVLELATVARKRNNSALLLEAVLAHCHSLSGGVSAICLDVSPTQFPHFGTNRLPDEVVEECTRVNGKLRKWVQTLCKRPALRELETRLVRYCHPEVKVEKL
jgi:hypothetical protein